MEHICYDSNKQFSNHIILFAVKENIIYSDPWNSDPSYAVVNNYCEGIISAGISIYKGDFFNKTPPEN